MSCCLYLFFLTLFLTLKLNDLLGLDPMDERVLVPPPYAPDALLRSRSRSRCKSRSEKEEGIVASVEETDPDSVDMNDIKTIVSDSFDKWCEAAGVSPSTPAASSASSSSSSASQLNQMKSHFFSLFQSKPQSNTASIKHDHEQQHLALNQHEQNASTRISVRDSTHESNGEAPPSPYWHWWDEPYSLGYEPYLLRWETELQIQMGHSIQKMLQDLASMAVQNVIAMTLFASLASAMLWPAVLIKMTDVIDNQWTIAIERADLAGKELAEVSRVCAHTVSCICSHMNEVCIFTDQE